MQTDNHTASAPLPQAAFALSESAAARINALKVQDGKPNLKFRVQVNGGGCSGFQYEFILGEGVAGENDTVISLNGAEVLIDDVSLDMLKGSVLDWHEDLSGSAFEIKNPNATAKCGCGNSFAM